MIRHILVMLLAISNISVAAIITHSHCPNHTRNNSDNMHTHDTSDPDHNAKHVSGHPHTWEFDEFCPEGYERDTSKKSGGFPTKTTPTDVETDTTDDTTRQQGFASQGGGGGVSKRQTAPTDTRKQFPWSGPIFTGPDILRITHLSYQDNTLTLQLAAESERVRHNYLNIRINDSRSFQTPALFFGNYEFSKGNTREISFILHENGRSIILKRSPYVQMIQGKAYRYKAETTVYPYGWQTINDFDINRFEVALRSIGQTTDRDSITQADIDSDGNRIGSVRGAPSIKRTLIGTWASLKKAGL